MDNKEQKKIWNSRAKEDARYWVLTDDRSGNTDAYYDSGEEDVHAYVGENTDFKNLTCLDYGCGTGRLSRALATRFKQVIGVDISESMIEEAQKDNPNIQFLVSDGVTIPLQNMSVDYVFSFASLQHVPDRAQVLGILREMHRTLKPGGTLNVQVRATPGGWGGRAVWWKSWNTCYVAVIRRSFIFYPYFGFLGSLFGAPFKKSELLAFAEALGLRDVAVHQEDPRQLWIRAIK